MASEVSGGSVCLNSFSGLISGMPAVVIKMVDPRSGPLELVLYLDFQQL
jgi:hypothetical protein